MKATLVVEDGPMKGNVIPLRGKKTLIGRGPDCDLQVLDEGLSRVHCLLEKKGDVYFVTDLNSRNGTFKNGERVESEQISSGDLISIGDTKLRFTRTHTVLVEAPPAAHVRPVEGKGEKIERRLKPSKMPLIAASRRELALAESDRLQRDLATMYEIGNLISTENELKVLCALIMDSILGVVEVDRGFLLLGGSVDDTRAVVVRGEKGSRETDLTLSKTILAEALEKGVAVMSSNAMEDERFREGESIIAHHITSAMCVPLESEGDILGAIYVDTIGASRAFEAADLELLTAIGRQAGVAIERARLMEDLENLFYDSVSTLVATIEANDPYTRGHSERVTLLAVSIGRVMGMDSEMIGTIRLTGLLHDIGKVSIPAVILNKKDPLTDAEWGTIKTHPEVGANIISNIRRMKESIISAVRHHHERWDGTGYPEGLKEDQIPLISRILAVADAFDAMTSKRAYREYVRSIEEATRELEDCADRQFDRSVVDAFIRGCKEGQITGVNESERQKDS